MADHRNRRLRTAHLWQIVSALVVVCLGSLIISSKLGAKAQAAALGAPLAAKSGLIPSASAAPALAAANPPPIPTASIAAAGSAAPPVSAASTSGASAATAATSEAASGDKDEVVNLTLGGAVIQDESDIPPGLSPEQIDSLGNGKVPIHREGKYRSPLANPTSGGPAMVKVGLVVSEIRDYQITDGSFSADFFLSFTADKLLPKLHPVFTNGHEVNCTSIVDVETFRFYRCTGAFTSGVDLRNYPFDTQFLDINVEDAVYGVDTVIFAPDPRRTSLDATFRLSGYGVASVGATAIKHQYPSRFDRDDLYVSRYKFTLGLDRFAQSAAFSVYVPAFIIVLISLIGLWVPPDELEVRSAAGAPMLAAAVLFHYSLIQSLPATGYLTHADKLMLGVYVSLLINMATTWVFLIVDEERLTFWFKVFRAWTPPLTAAVMAASVFV
ncbi:MAG TPA: hypothetical protein VER12_06820 [Polyangiaceae bacterium]|nr:hypothetical protein [Polyangiaceae bacterium]